MGISSRAYFRTAERPFDPEAIRVERSSSEATAEPEKIGGCISVRQ
jgi:hypothetical protein